MIFCDFQFRFLSRKLAALAILHSYVGNAPYRVLFVFIAVAMVFRLIFP